MANYKTRIESLIGSVNDDTALTDLFNSAIKYVIDLIPAEKLETYYKSLTVNTSGLTITGIRPIYAHKNNYIARRLNLGEVGRANDTASIFRATDKDPVWYILDSKVYVLPNGGVLIAVQYPTNQTITSTSITDFPNEYDHAVVLYTAINGRIKQISDLTANTLNSLTFQEISFPPAPSSPSFNFNNVTYTDATYNSASYTSAIYEKALIDTIASTLITFNETLNYNSLALTPSYSSVDSALTNQDIELSNAHLNKINTQLEEYQKNLLNSLNEFNKNKEQFTAKLQVAIENARLTQERLIQQTREQIELNKFNAQKFIETELANYQSKSQVDIANRRAELELSINNKAKKLESDILNASKQLETQISQYEMNLRLYAQQTEQAAQRLNQEVSRITAMINKYNLQYQQLSLGLDKLREEFNNYIKGIQNGNI